MNSFLLLIMLRYVVLVALSGVNRFNADVSIKEFLIVVPALSALTRGSLSLSLQNYGMMILGTPPPQLQPFHWILP
jgi:hypothetical protein